MVKQANFIAEKASFHAFLNGYIREVDHGIWYGKEEFINKFYPSYFLKGENILTLHLPKQSIVLAIEIEYRSEVGKHLFGTVLSSHDSNQDWEGEDYLSAIVLLIRELHLQSKNNLIHQEGAALTYFDELLVRFFESYKTMAVYLDHRLVEPLNSRSKRPQFIETEQSLLFGHWFHPTPKSRQGMANWQHNDYAPELAGQFQLHYFRVKNEYIKQESALEIKAVEMIDSSIEQGEVSNHSELSLIPMHPLQTQWLLQQTYVQEAINRGIMEYLGPLGAAYTATSSMRTVYNANQDWMLKFSIPVKITNSLRVNRLAELKAGVAMAKLKRALPFFQNHPTFEIIDDLAYLTVNLPGRKETGFETIIRVNPFRGEKSKGISSIAALVQDPMPGEKSLLVNQIEALTEKEICSGEEVSLKWFKKYLENVMVPLISLFDEHGIALEAHQQNSLLDLTTNYPERYYYRDNQGYYLSKEYQQELVEEQSGLKFAYDLFYEETMIHERFTYYLFFNHLFSIINRFGIDQLISENELMSVLTQRMEELEQELKGAGRRFIHHLLNREKLPFKANLLTRLLDVDELEADFEQAVYAKFDNPFLLYRANKREEDEYAVTSKGHV
ncbi:IucA/IucC family protein [Alkalihalobacillus sp. 1P02AB]|uniref:IucA/IucC family protein n=1 Tax=Alkalihalobacillus sp. 1P02AB TaxID=3132260 RepID=UPI0039A462F4